MIQFNSSCILLNFRFENLCYEILQPHIWFFVIKYVEMKKLLVVILCIFSVLLQASVSFAFPASQKAGEKLKELGIVKGYGTYGLQEKRVITEGEFLALIARVIKAKEIEEIPDAIKQQNTFDEIANSVYKFFEKFRKFFIKYYYLTLSLYPKYEPARGVNRESWFFEDALYLKIKGFKFPDDFSCDSPVTPEKMFEFLLSAMSLNKADLTRVPENFSQENLLRILLVQQGLFDETYLSKASVTRGEAFNIILFLYENK